MLLGVHNSTVLDTGGGVAETLTSTLRGGIGGGGGGGGGNGVSDTCLDGFCID